jgi:uncharacterized protein (TIGR02001 family)
MKLFKVSLCAAVAVASLAMASAASAEVTFNAGIATDYVFRGIKQTTGDCCGESSPQVFGGADWTGGPNLYAGVWASNTGSSSSNGIETDVYGGWKPVVGPVTLDLGVIYYAYNSSNDGAINSSLNTLEWKAGASIAAGPASLGAAVYYSDDYISTGEDSWYYEVTGSVPLKEGVLLSGGVGHFKSDALDVFSGGDADSYTTWNVGLTLAVTEKVSVDARYINTNKDATDIFGSLAADDQLVGTLKVNF